MKKILLLIILLLFSFGNNLLMAKSKDIKLDKQEIEFEQYFEKNKKDIAVAQIIKDILRNMHISNKKIKDIELFDFFLKKIDREKLFITRDDITNLSYYRKNFYNRYNVGGIFFLKKIKKIITSNLKYIKKHLLLKKNITYSDKSMFESDADKRSYVKNKTELLQRWRTFHNFKLVLTLVNEMEDKKEKGEKYNLKKLKIKIKKDVVEDSNLFLEKVLNKKYSDYYNIFINTLTSYYDPHSTYFAPEDVDEFNEDMRGSFYGIGAILKLKDKIIEVESIIPGGPSWNSDKLNKGDKIIAVIKNGKEINLRELELAEAIKKIKGKNKSIVKLVILNKQNKKKIIRIKRGPVFMDDTFVKYSLFKKQNHNIGYIKLPKFYRNFDNVKETNCTKDMIVAIKALKKQNIKSLILDLRNNGGGALADANLIIGLFLKNGETVKILNREGKVTTTKDQDNSVLYKGKLYVLINKNSASASEIVAAALQDHGRAIIIGTTRSHGKGSVQVVFSLADYLSSYIKMFKLDNKLGSLKITTQKFYRITGESTQFKGVSSDIVLPEITESLGSTEQELDYPLKWDTIKSTTKAKKYIIKPKVLKNNNERVSHNQYFQKVHQLNVLNKKNEEESYVAIDLDSTIKRRKLLNKLVEDIDTLKKESKLLFNISIKDSLLIKDVYKLKRNKRLIEELKERRDEYHKMIREDFFLNEVVNIVLDDL